MSPPKAKAVNRADPFKRLSVHQASHTRLLLCGQCFPRTGRQHQIRLHLEAAGHPIVGDKLYGMPEDEALRFYERLASLPKPRLA